MDFICWFTDFVKTIVTTFVKSFSKWEALFMPRKRKLIYFSLDLDEFEPYYDM